MALNIQQFQGADIIESSFSTSENYIKFGDGTMIQWGLISGTQAIDVARGSLYIRYFTSITFPEEFYTPPVVTVEHLDNSGAVDDREFWASCGNPSTTSVATCLWSPVSIGSATHTVGYQAIGRWK